VKKLGDGQIVYAWTSLSASILASYNTLTNPKGSKVIDITLSDGSRVWLNAGSSITYPIAFAGNERKITMNGEAYFEVTHNPEMPFKVCKGDMEVAVLGTHFNVNAFDDEASVRVTLLEGSIKASINGSTGPGGQSTILKPGEQAQIAAGINVVRGIDIEEVMAWKNGNFYFNGADIQTIMRQVARWYDVEVVYEGGLPTGHYNGKPSRALTVSEMLKVVEYSGVKIRIDGRKIIVMK